MNQMICGAIREKRIVELRYHSYSRFVEPYAYGRGRDGEGLLRCYQLSGGSESGERIGWKLLKTAEIFALQLTDSHFISRPEYRRGDKAMEFIFCQL
jgi:hypothetical protein